MCKVVQARAGVEEFRPATFQSPPPPRSHHPALPPQKGTWHRAPSSSLRCSHLEPPLPPPTPSGTWARTADSEARLRLRRPLCRPSCRRLRRLCPFLRRRCRENIRHRQSAIIGGKCRKNRRGRRLPIAAPQKAKIHRGDGSLCFSPIVVAHFPS
jgi:hypothetical protein